MDQTALRQLCQRRTGDAKETSHSEADVNAELVVQASEVLTKIYGKFVFPIQGFADISVTSGTTEYDLGNSAVSGEEFSMAAVDAGTTPGIWPFVHLLKVFRTDLDSVHPVPCHFPKMGSHRRIGYSRALWPPPGILAFNRSPALYLRGNRFLGFHTSPTSKMTLRVFVAPELDWSVASEPKQIPRSYQPLIALYAARALLGGEESPLSVGLEIEIGRRELTMDETIRPLRAVHNLAMA